MAGHQRQKGLNIRKSISFDTAIENPQVLSLSKAVIRGEIFGTKNGLVFHSYISS